MTVLVTGANRGIGLELARQLTGQGHRVIGTARKPAEATELKALGATVMQLDVTDTDSVAELAAGLDGQPIDLLINNAGTGGQPPGSLQETDFERVKLTFDVNSIGPMRVTQALLPNLLAGEGKKIDLLRQYPQVCFEVEAGVKIVPGEEACNWGVTYRSIIGYGRSEYVTDAGEKPVPWTVRIW